MGTNNYHELCDWAEAQALAVARRSCVLGDIESYIKPDDSTVDLGEPAADEAEVDASIAINVLDVARWRLETLGKQYPFSVSNTGIVPCEKMRRYHEAYLFCLLLSILSQDEMDGDVRHWFEVECQEALHDYFGGESFHFGWTRLNSTTGRIQRRVEEFCASSSLRWSARKPVLVSAARNDIGIDAIVWKQSDDGRDGAFVALGQCATGHNWDQKLESAAHSHINDCLERPHVGPIVKCFMTPFHVPPVHWRERHHSVDGLLFDRIRFVLESQQSNSRKGHLYRRETRNWLESKLARLSS